MILGYACQKYKIVRDDGVHYVWAAKSIYQQGSYFPGVCNYSEIEGTVLKQEMNYNQQEVILTEIITAISYQKVSISDSVFNIPVGYQMIDGMPPQGSIGK